MRDGKVAWKTWLVPEPKQTHVTATGTKRYGPSGVGVWSAPAVDAARGLIYVGTGNDYTHPATALSDSVLALQMKTGRIEWSRQISPQDVFNAQCARGGDKDIRIRRYRVDATSQGEQGNQKCGTHGGKIRTAAAACRAKPPSL